MYLWADASAASPNQCKQQLQWRVKQLLMGAASSRLKCLGHGAEQTLALQRIVARRRQRNPGSRSLPARPPRTANRPRGPQKAVSRTEAT